MSLKGDVQLIVSMEDMPSIIPEELEIVWKGDALDVLRQVSDMVVVITREQPAERRRSSTEQPPLMTKNSSFLSRNWESTTSRALKR